MSCQTDTPVTPRSRTGSADGSVHSYGTATVVASQSRNDSMFKPPATENSTTDDMTPLLANGSHMRRSEAWRTALKEAYVLARYAAPIVCTMLLEYSFLIVSVITIGHLSTEQLAGAALGEITAAVTGLSIVQGFVSALESVLPHAWTSENPSHVGLWTQRMLVLMTFLIIPIIAIWLNAESLFLHLRQDPIVAQYAAVYLRYLVLMLPPFAFNRVIRQYFQAQGLMHVPTMVVVIVTPINIVLNYLLVWGPESIRLGFIGAPIATSISMFLVSCLYTVYGIFFSSHTAWHPISLRAFANLPTLFSLGLAGVGQTAAEWWSWEFISLAASQFGPTTLAAQSILAVSSSTAFMFHAGLGTASAVRIGNLLGAGNSNGALVASKVAMVLAVIESLVMATIFMSLGSRLAYLFNNDPTVAKLVSGIVPLLALHQIMDAISATSGGVLRACGKISTGAASNFIGYYVLGIPLGLLLAFKFNLALFGLWAGIVIALLFVSIVLYLAVLRLDWEVQVQEAKERIESGEGHTNVTVPV